MTIAVATAAAVIAVIVGRRGSVRSFSSLAARASLGATAFCWRDIFGGDDARVF
jgi:hypothetical protein